VHVAKERVGIRGIACPFRLLFAVLARFIGCDVFPVFLALGRQLIERLPYWIRKIVRSDVSLPERLAEYADVCLVHAGLTYEFARRSTWMFKTIFCGFYGSLAYRFAEFRMSRLDYPRAHRKSF
jgi:hypothetical protein